jgi:hypothetical protein
MTTHLRPTGPTFRITCHPGHAAGKVDAVGSDSPAPTWPVAIGLYQPGVASTG